MVAKAKLLSNGLMSTSPQSTIFVFAPEYGLIPRIGLNERKEVCRELPARIPRGPNRAPGLT